MTDAEESPEPVGVRGAAASKPVGSPWVSTVVWGTMAVAVVAIIRAAVLGPDADSPGRLLLLIGGIGVPLSLFAVMMGATVRRQRPVEAATFALVLGVSLSAAAVALVGVTLQLGPAAGAKYRVALWQVETDPVVALILGLVAIGIAVGGRFGSGPEPGSVGSRRATAVIGACVVAPVIRRLFGRAGDGDSSFTMTVVLLLFDLIILSIVAAVANRGFGFGRAVMSLRPPVGSGRVPEAEEAG